MKKTMMFLSAVGIFCCLHHPRLEAQEASPLGSNLRTALFGELRPAFETAPLALPRGEEVRARKSPLRAALYSIAIPGAGQWYAESPFGAAGFLGGEVALWVVYAVYENRGDRKTDEFQRFADDHWSVVRYAQWIALYGPTLNPDALNGSGIVTNRDPTLPPWERVDWDELNRVEESIGRKSSTGFSHRLPRRPEQQYYELIGKYEQYNPGWDDANVTDADYLTNISPRFLQYRDLRGLANDLYNIAGTATLVLLANHVISALHASWSAAHYNKSLDLQGHLLPVPRSSGIVEFVPTAVLSVRF